MLKVTVCVAAFADNHTLIGASDRMLTAGDVKFEPPQTKIVSLTNSIAVMLAGDSGMQTEIILSVQAEVQRRVQEHPLEWLHLRDVADLYREQYNAVRARRAEQAILAPLGLTYQTFHAQQQLLAPQLVTQIATELLNYDAPAVQTIFAGVDLTGGHLYAAHNGSITCHDGVGFVAIGAGYWHADSQMMFAGHARAKPFPETLLLTYSAKKRAEVAPGVGEYTDMFAIGPNLGSYISVGDHVLTKLEEIYQKTQKSIHGLNQKANKTVKRYVEEINAAATAKGQETPSENRGRGEPAHEANAPAAPAHGEPSGEGKHE